MSTEVFRWRCLQRAQICLEPCLFGTLRLPVDQTDALQQVDSELRWECSLSFGAEVTWSTNDSNSEALQTSHDDDSSSSDMVGNRFRIATRPSGPRGV